MFPDTKTKGNGGHRFVVFTSVHGHYSVEKAAILCGFGSEAVWQVGVDKEGRMIVPGLYPSQNTTSRNEHRSSLRKPWYMNR